MSAGVADRTGYPRPATAVGISVVARVAREEHVPEDVARRWFEEMLKFLDTVGAMRRARDRRALVPSPQVDAAWHAFILHTRPYSEFCERHHGGYVHHDVAPPDAPEGDPGALLDYLVTRVLIGRRYGPIDEAAWPLNWGEGPAEHDAGEAGRGG